MINIQKICVFDFETDSVDPYTTNPVELAALMIDPRKLEIVPDSLFVSDMRPIDIDVPGYYEKHKDTIGFHARKKNKSHEEILERWKKAPMQEQVWRNFSTYVGKYNSNQDRKTKYSAPIAAGFNINKFDLIICDKLNKRYDIKTLWHMRDVIDALPLCFMWFENSIEPKAYNFDAVREFLGMSGEGAHSADVDVKDTAVLIMKMLKLMRSTASKVIWNSKNKVE